MKSLLSAAVLAGLVLVFGTAANAQQKKIGMKRAQSIAVSNAPGLTLKAKELENEKGTWIYSFEFREKNGDIREVNVNAFTGEAVVEHESKKSEATEEKGEKKEKH